MNPSHIGKDFSTGYDLDNSFMSTEMRYSMLISFVGILLRLLRTGVASGTSHSRIEQLFVS